MLKNFLILFEKMFINLFFINFSQNYKSCFCKFLMKISFLSNFYYYYCKTRAKILIFTKQLCKKNLFYLSSK